MKSLRFRRYERWRHWSTPLAAISNFSHNIIHRTSLLTAMESFLLDFTRSIQEKRKRLGAKQTQVRLETYLSRPLGISIFDSFDTSVAGRIRQVVNWI